jgi:hypothetical protein
MHDPDALTRLRWRLLAWGIGAVILLPVLYVGALGPLTWWDYWHSHDPAWFEKYYHSLKPLRGSPQVDEIFVDYESWWLGRTPPRSWRRGPFAERVEALRKDLRKVEQDLINRPQRPDDPHFDKREMLQESLQWQLQRAEWELRVFDGK